MSTDDKKYSKSIEQAKSTAINTAIEAGVAYGCHVAGASYSVSTIAPMLVSNTIHQEYKAGERYVENYRDAKRDGMTNDQASRYASMMDRPFGE
jgi:hypothetical protein